MVRQGNFTVELVDAETNVAFQEHVKPTDGSHYVEVEPNAEYWIRVQSHVNHVCKCYFKVDGSNLGFNRTIRTAETPHFVGDWETNGWKSTMRALKVRTLLVKEEEGGNEPNDTESAPSVGTVQVNIYKAFDDGTQTMVMNMEDRKSTWKERTAVSKKHHAGKKAVASSRGAKIKESRLGQTRTMYKLGKLLETITLHYCTAAGLIHYNVLPKPPPASLDNAHPLDTSLAHNGSNNNPSLDSGMEASTEGDYDDDDDNDDETVVVASDPIRSQADILQDKKASAIDLTNTDDNESDDDNEYDEHVVSADNTPSADAERIMLPVVAAKSEKLRERNTS